MTLARARIIKGAFPTEGDVTRPGPIDPLFGRRVPREVMDARAEAERILTAAREGAAKVAAQAAGEAREQETARLAAQFLALKKADEDRAERDLARAIDIATVLAERLVGEGLRIEPQRIAELAASALAETRGARHVRIDAHPDDVTPLREALAAVGHAAEVNADGSLARGSLVVHTDVGTIDARLRPQLARLADALRGGSR
jgi:flagellar biosynthesis/type III secretory pathway protein FliH